MLLTEGLTVRVGEDGRAALLDTGTGTVIADEAEVERGVFIADQRVDLSVDGTTMTVAVELRFPGGRALIEVEGPDFTLTMAPGERYVPFLGATVERREDGSHAVTYRS